MFKNTKTKFTFLLALLGGLGCSSQNFEEDFSQGDSTTSDTVPSEQAPESCFDWTLNEAIDVQSHLETVLDETAKSKLFHITHQRTFDEVVEIETLGMREEVDGECKARYFKLNASVDERENYILVDRCSGFGSISEYESNSFYGSVVKWGMKAHKEPVGDEKSSRVDFLRTLPEDLTHRNMMDTDLDGVIDVYYDIYATGPLHCHENGDELIATGVAIIDTDFDGLFDRGEIGYPYNK